MQHRPLGRTGLSVSTISFGAWAIGGSWGRWTTTTSMAALHAAIDAGVNFVDTADVYGDGRSERLVAKLRRERTGEPIAVATKAGRRLPAQTPEGYTRENLTGWIDRSLAISRPMRIDLLQLHCPHPAVYDRPDVFGILDDLTCAAGSFATTASASKPWTKRCGRCRYPNVQDGADHLQRVPPPARGALLRGSRGESQSASSSACRWRAACSRASCAAIRCSIPTTIARSIARDEAFDKGETFSGVPYDLALSAVDDCRPLVPEGWTMAQFALRWILMWDAVSCTIPARARRTQARENAAAADLPAIAPEAMSAIRRIYSTRLAPVVHASW